MKLKCIDCMATVQSWLISSDEFSLLGRNLLTCMLIDRSLWYFRRCKQDPEAPKPVSTQPVQSVA